MVDPPQENGGGVGGAPPRVRSPATPVAVGYVVLSSLWILVSDWAAGLLVAGERYAELQTVKGWIFVSATGVLLWTVLHRYWRARVAAQEREEQSERRLESALGELQAAFLQIAAREPHTILAATRGIRELAGYTESELVEPARRDARELIHPEDRRVVLTAVKASALDGRPFVFEFRLLSRTGEVRWVWCKGRSLPGGNAVEMFVTNVSRLKQLQAQLVAAQGIEALAELAAGVAHDTNNHLTVVSGYVDLLEGSLEQGEPEAASTHLAEVRRAIRRVHGLNQRLMSLGRSSENEVGAVDLNDLVTEVGELVRPMLRRRIAVECELAPAPVVVRGDPQQLERVVVNLVVNARDAMPEGGRLHIAAAVREVNGDLELAHLDLPPGPRGSLTVSDTGTGIPADDRERIFEPFFTTKAAGTGLGLAVAAGLVERNGGRILVESEPGEGTQFEILLPLVLTPEREGSGPAGERASVAAPVWSWRKNASAARQARESGDRSDRGSGENRHSVEGPGLE